MAAVRDELVEATGLKAKSGEEDIAFRVRMVKAVEQLPDDKWNGLSSGAQTWYNEAVESVKSETRIAPFPGEKDDDAEADDDPTAPPEPDDDASNDNDEDEVAEKPKTPAKTKGKPAPKKAAEKAEKKPATKKADKPEKAAKDPAMPKIRAQRDRLQSGCSAARDVVIDGFLKSEKLSPAEVQKRVKTAGYDLSVGVASRVLRDTNMLMRRLADKGLLKK